MSTVRIVFMAVAQKGSLGKHDKPEFIADPYSIKTYHAGGLLMSGLEKNNLHCQEF